MKRQKRNDSNINEYKGLYGEKAVQPEDDYLFLEPLETRSRLFGWKIEPHIHSGLYQIFFISSGSFDFYDAGKRNSLHGPCIIVIPPTALHGFHFQEDVRGTIFTISDQLMHALTHNAGFISAMFTGIVTITDFTGHYSSQMVDNLLKLIDVELTGNEQEKLTMLNLYVQQLLLIIYRKWKSREEIAATPDQQGLNYFRLFQERLKHIDAKTTVTQIAMELGITPVHLNRICNKMAGKPASALINDRLIRQAKQYLNYTSYSVSQIAYLLNFEYPNYFARFFRKHTGISPSMFREGHTNQ